MRFVLDNSVVIRWAFREQNNYAESILKKIIDNDFIPIAPSLLELEFVNVTIRTLSKEVNGKKDEVQSEFKRINSKIEALQIEICSQNNKDEIANLMIQHNLTSYDASYLELAKREKCPLATLDKDLIGACIKEGVQVFNA